ncbi:MAG: arginase family protein [Bdellovibrionota bacterium]
MQNEFAFLGLGIESGQTLKGLRDSSHYAKIHLAQHYDFDDLGMVFGNKVYEKIQSLDQLCNFTLQPYFEAQARTIEALEQKKFLVNWGGDHSVGISTVSGFTKVYPAGWTIWIDAHADLNTPEASLSGSFHGMPLSLLLGLGSGSSDKNIFKTLNPKKLIYFGLRDVDSFEVKAIRKLGIKTFTTQMIRELGINHVIREITNLTRGQDVHISFDIDSLDPEFAASTGVPVNNGLVPSEIFHLADELSEKSNVVSLDIVEINPYLGSAQEISSTYQIANLFLEHILLGKKIFHRKQNANQPSHFMLA